LDGVEVQEGQIIALHNGKLVSSSASLAESVFSLLEVAVAEDYELITLFYGNNITKNEVFQLVDQIRLRYPKQEIEVQEGCQPHYQFIISIE
jgi:hypothetical protein